jgi:hypothetical protein
MNCRTFADFHPGQAVKKPPDTMDGDIIPYNMQDHHLKFQENRFNPT